MRPRTVALGSCILAAFGLAAAILIQPGVPAPAAAPPPIQVPGIPTVIQVAPGAPVPGPVIDVLPPLPKIDPPPADKPKMEKPAPAPALVTIPVPPKEAIQKPAEPACQPCPVYCQPRCWSWRRCR